MSKSSKDKKIIDDSKLNLLAEQELLGEAKRGAVRYSVAGPSGWNPCPLPKANKIFLVNTIRSTISSNRITEKSIKPKIKIKERKMFRGRKSPGYCADNIVFKPPVKKDHDFNSKKSQTLSSATDKKESKS